jgi:hypothetical protein
MNPKCLRVRLENKTDFLVSDVLEPKSHLGSQSTKMIALFVLLSGHLCSIGYQVTPENCVEEQAWLLLSNKKQ